MSLRVINPSFTQVENNLLVNSLALSANAVGIDSDKRSVYPQTVGSCFKKRLDTHGAFKAAYCLAARAVGCSAFSVFVSRVTGSWRTGQVSRIRIISEQQTLVTRGFRWELQMDSSQSVTIATRCEYQDLCSSLINVNCLINFGGFVDISWQCNNSSNLFFFFFFFFFFFTRGSFYDSFFE